MKFDYNGDGINDTTIASVYTGIDRRSEQGIPSLFKLDQNYPNPFNPATTIRYSLPGNCRVKLSVYNSLGQLIKELVNGEKSAGSYEVQFDGSKLASGVYFYSIKASSLDGAKDFSSVKKLILIK